MNTTTVLFCFGLRSEQEGLPGYLSGRSGTFRFIVRADNEPKTWEEATDLFLKNKDEFLRKLVAENISCHWQPVETSMEWIPACYLYSPEYITVGMRFSFMPPGKMVRY